MAPLTFLQGKKICECNMLPDGEFLLVNDIFIFVSPLTLLLINVFLAPDVFARIDAHCAYESARIDKKFHL